MIPIKLSLPATQIPLDIYLDMSSRCTKTPFPTSSKAFLEPASGFAKLSVLKCALLRSACALRGLLRPFGASAIES